MIDLLTLTLPELESWLSEQGEPRFRARQLYTWLHRQLETDFRRMTTLPERLREVLAARATVAPLVLRRELISKDRRTRKVLLELGDGRLI